MLISTVHKSIIVMNSIDTRFSRNDFEAVQKTRSTCFIESKTTRLRLVVLNPIKHSCSFFKHYMSCCRVLHVFTRPVGKRILLHNVQMLRLLATLNRLIMSSYRNMQHWLWYLSWQNKRIWEACYLLRSIRARATGRPIHRSLNRFPCILAGQPKLSKDSRHFLRWMSGFVHDILCKRQFSIRMSKRTLFEVIITNSFTPLL